MGISMVRERVRRFYCLRMHAGHKFYNLIYDVLCRIAHVEDVDPRTEAGVAERVMCRAEYALVVCSNTEEQQWRFEFAACFARVTHTYCKLPAASERMRGP
jgi:hypothetical protein